MVAFRMMLKFRIHWIPITRQELCNIGCVALDKLLVLKKRILELLYYPNRFSFYLWLSARY